MNKVNGITLTEPDNQPKQSKSPVIKEKYKQSTGTNSKKSLQSLTKLYNSLQKKSKSSNNLNQSNSHIHGNAQNRSHITTNQEADAHQLAGPFSINELQHQDQQYLPQQYANQNQGASTVIYTKSGMSSNNITDAKKPPVKESIFVKDIEQQERGVERQAFDNTKARPLSHAPWNDPENVCNT